MILSGPSGSFCPALGACALAGLSILDARITTTKDGLAIDALHVRCSEAGRGPLDGPRAKRGAKPLRMRWLAQWWCPSKWRRWRRRAVEAFGLTPQVNMNNDLSDKATVIEVSGLDRPGLLYALVRQLFNLNVSVQAARVATFGERAVDVFYVTGLTGDKINRSDKKKQLRSELLTVIDNPVARQSAEA